MMRIGTRWIVGAAALCGLLIPGADLRAEPYSAIEAANTVDRLITESLAEEGIEPSDPTTDEDFLRRVHLDLTGDIPAPNEIALFGLDPDDNKRVKKIDELLASDGHAEIWAIYWRDVIFSRATEARSRIVQPVFESWMKEQIAAGRGWDEITRDLLTATGNITTDGQTALMFAHTGQPAELAAETSRIFLGVQIQCANCHNHPTDSWNREQFHELAAFFPRVSVRRDPNGTQRDFVIASADNLARRGRQQFDPARVFRTADRDGDGRVTKEEAERLPAAGRFFDRALQAGDKNKDGALTEEEFLAVAQMPMNQPGRGSAEYFMPDLDNPSNRGTLTTPVFFLSGASLDEGADDITRRSTLADAITSPENPWFAKAYINRIWTEMLGEGFVTPVDDMGPERSSIQEPVLDYLAEQFAENGHDIQWLFRVIANTDAYQRAIRDREPGSNITAFASPTATRLRSDQIYNSVRQALGLTSLGGRPPVGRGMGPGPRGGDPARAAFAALFGFDPSTPQEDIVGSIPQALFLMNSPQLAQATSSRGNTVLARILRDFPDDADATAELYLRVLCREPSEAEQNLFDQYLADSEDRGEAYEDLMWTLLNSSEFLSKR